MRLRREPYSTCTIRRMRYDAELYWFAKANALSDIMPRSPQSRSTLIRGLPKMNTGAAAIPVVGMLHCILKASHEVLQDVCISTKQCSWRERIAN
jgi:hypothetical protein